MPAIIMANTWRPRPGKLAAFLGNCSTAKTIHTRLGGQVRLRANQFGGAPLSYVYTIEVASWEAMGAFGAAMDADAEWRAFWGAAAADPSADLDTSAVVVEAEI